MSDIVERLRFRADENYEMLGNIHEPLLEAAEEIERLRAALARNAVVAKHATTDAIADILDRIAAQRDHHARHLTEQSNLCCKYMAAGETRDGADASGKANAHILALTSYSELLKELEKKYG